MIFLLSFYLILGMLISYFRSDQEKIRIYQMFHRYLPPQVMEKIMNNTDSLQLGGTEKEAADKHATAGL